MKAPTNRISHCLAVIAAMLLAGCGSSESSDQSRAPGRVTGTVTSAETVTLPPDAMIRVVLADVSRQDAPAIFLGEDTIRETTLPVAFEIVFDPSAIQDDHTYAVQARVLVGDDLKFTSVQHHGVLTQGNTNQVEVRIQAVGDAGAP